MKIRAIELIEKGFFCQELPPAFTTGNLGIWYRALSKADKLALASGTTSSECIYFSIPKAGLSRRNLSIPNPKAYIALSKQLEKNSTEIEKYLESRLSSSTPASDKTRKRACVTKQDFGSFVRHRFLISREATFELKVDISRYYPTIYTHIIPWALHGRENAKKDKSDSLLGNVLDRDSRKLQSDQTMGIPIGPDTSLIISELIGARLDREIEKKFPNIKAARYIDDYYFYLDSRAQAETVLKYVQSLMADFLLAPNDEKTVIKEFPFSTDPPWKISLRSLRATCFKDDSESEQESDIRQFFSAAFDCAEKYPKDEVMKFAAKTIFSVKISNKNWKYFEAWLIKMGLYDPYTLKELSAILFANYHRLSKDLVADFLHELLDKHVMKRHSYEVSWALWMFKIFRINLESRVAAKLFDANDVIPTIMALDLQKAGLIEKSVKIDVLEADLCRDALHDGRWLLAYEVGRRNWLKPSTANKDYLKLNTFFGRLSKDNVSFYNEKTPSPVPRTDTLVRKAKTVSAEEVFEIKQAARNVDKTELLRWLPAGAGYSL